MECSLKREIVVNADLRRDCDLDSENVQRSAPGENTKFRTQDSASNDAAVTRAGDSAELLDRTDAPCGGSPLCRRAAPRRVSDAWRRVTLLPRRAARVGEAVKLSSIRV